MILFICILSINDKKLSRGLIFIVIYVYVSKPYGYFLVHV